MSEEHVIGLFSHDGCPAPQTAEAERGDGPAPMHMRPVDEPCKGEVGDSPGPAGGAVVDAHSASAGNVAPETKADLDETIRRLRETWGETAERRPGGPHRANWRQVQVRDDAPNPFVLRSSGWTDGRLQVISSAILAAAPGKAPGPWWLLTATSTTRLMKSLEMRRLLRAFGMEGARCERTDNVWRFFLEVE